MFLTQTHSCAAPPPHAPCHHGGSAQHLLSLSSLFSFARSSWHHKGNVMFHAPQMSCSPLFLEESRCFPGMRLPCALPTPALLPCWQPCPWHPVPYSTGPSGSSPTLSLPGVELQLPFPLELVWASPAPLLPPLSAPAQWKQAALVGFDLSSR